jgi:hypothetical protein
MGHWAIMGRGKGKTLLPLPFNLFPLKKIPLSPSSIGNDRIEKPSTL